MNIFYWLFDKLMSKERPMSWDQLSTDQQAHVKNKVREKGTWPAVTVLKSYGFTEDNAMLCVRGHQEWNLQMTPDEVALFEAFKKSLVCTPEQIARNPDWTRAYVFGDDLPTWIEGHATEEQIQKVMGDDVCSIHYVHLSYGEELTRGMIP